MSDDAIAEHPFASAEEFLAALRPGNALWKADPGAWVFRGHADANWLLVPSQNRRASLAAYFGTKYRGEDPYCVPDPADLGALMEKFVYALDRAGHVIPGKGIFTIEKIAEKVRSGQPDADTHEVVALAQHHELPTYMLDWTRHSNFAAYFAASETAKLPGDLTGKIEVWALQSKIVDGMTRSRSRIGETPVRLLFSTPPRGGNPNLHARKAASSRTPRPLPGKDGPIFSADQVVRAMAEGSGFSGAVMRRMTLAQSEAGQVLHLLSHEPVTGASLFPGVAGVVRDVRDRAALPLGRQGSHPLRPQGLTSPASWAGRSPRLGRPFGFLERAKSTRRRRRIVATSGSGAAAGSASTVPLSTNLLSNSARPGFAVPWVAMLVRWGIRPCTTVPSSVT